MPVTDGGHKQPLQAALCLPHMRVFHTQTKWHGFREKSENAGVRAGEKREEGRGGGVDFRNECDS